MFKNYKTKILKNKKNKTKGNNFTTYNVNNEKKNSYIQKL